MFRVSQTKALEDQKANQGGVAAGAKEIISGSVKMLLSEQCYNPGAIVRREHYTDSNKYDNRIVDAFARLLYVLDSTSDRKNAVCASVAIMPNHDTTKCYLSYNCTADHQMQEKVRDLFKKLKDCVEKKNHDSLIQYCIAQRHKFYCPTIFTKTQIATLEEFLEIHNIQPLELKHFIANKYSSAQEIKNAYDVLYSTYSSKENFANISEILKNAQNKMVDWRKRLERDCSKIIHNFKNSCLEYLQVDNIIFLPNPDKIHSELHVREKLKSEGLYPRYIGTSKLSCLVCDIVISGDEEANKTIIHAGGHGISYPFDKLPTSVIEDKEMTLLRGLLQRTTAFLPIDTERQAYEIDSARQYANFSPIDETINRVYTYAEAEILALEYQQAQLCQSYRDLDNGLLGLSVLSI